jgi:hypothetical protein
MRTQFLFVGLLSIVAGGLVGTAGCDNITAGQPSDPSGPPQIVHIMIVEPRYNGGDRAVAVDLVDSAAPQACSDVLPCVPQFNLGFVTPDVSCSATTPGQQGTCNDPLLVTSAGVPLFVPVGSAAQGDAGSGTAIRVVFNKVLDNTIETITPAKDTMGNPITTPGKTLVYDLVPTVAKLVDPTNKEVSSKKILDNGGSPTFTSDLILAPLGPAIVIKPKAPLAPKTKYTIQLDGSAIKDRQGNTGVDQAGAPLGTPYSISFTTENVTLQTGLNAPNGSTTYPEFTQPALVTMGACDAKTPGACIAPNEVIQLNFWTTVNDPAAAGSMTTVSVTGPGGATVMVEAYLDAGSDTTMCANNTNPNMLDVFPVTAPGVAAAGWAAGNYTMTVNAQSDMNPAAIYTKTLNFTVAGAAGNPMTDTNTIDNHVLPETCTG